MLALDPINEKMVSVSITEVNVGESALKFGGCR